MSPRNSLATYCRTRTSGGSCGVPASPAHFCVNYLRCSTIPPVVSLAIPLARYLSIRFLPAVLFAFAAGIFEYTSGGSCGVPAFPRPDCVIYLRCRTIPAVPSLTVSFAHYLSLRFFLHFYAIMLAYIIFSSYLCSHLIGRFF